LVDDLIATGGTAEAAVKIVEKIGGEVAACAFVIELPELGGRQRLEAKGHHVTSICEFEGE
jgi:adenine phosphoribosyltransferase